MASHLSPQSTNRVTDLVSTEKKYILTRSSFGTSLYHSQNVSIFFIVCFYLCTVTCKECHQYSKVYFLRIRETKECFRGFMNMINYTRS